MHLKPGHWLGIDVGSSKRKVFNFCLIAIDPDCRIAVHVEHGGARHIDGTPFPANDAGIFDDQSRPTWLSQSAENHARNILENAILVKAWTAQLMRCTADLGVCIDAPCGFAAEGSQSRATETLTRSFATPSRSKFREDHKKWVDAKNHTPLRQRYFWKLIGLVAFRHFVCKSSGQDFDMCLEDLTKACVASPGRIRIREGFPSDTYRQKGETLSSSHSLPRQLLRLITAKPWASTGVIAPPTLAKLDTRRKLVSKQLQQDGPPAGMEKIPDDPRWADLWDAFTCAFVSCCESQGWAGFHPSDQVSRSSEGAILRLNEG